MFIEWTRNKSHMKPKPLVAITPKGCRGSAMGTLFERRQDVLDTLLSKLAPITTEKLLGKQGSLFRPGDPPAEGLVAQQQLSYIMGI